VHIFRLWQTFLVNVNPLVKIFHAPTVQQVILDASADLANIPRAIEALMFAIYLLAVTSLKTEECEAMFGESRSALLSKYSHGTQQALVNAKFLKSLNLYSLQAYALLLLALRRDYDPHTFWVLTGAAVSFLTLEGRK
jgi:Fungal specific transcription factor domain